MNLLVRTATALLFSALLIGCILCGQVPYMALFAVICFMTSVELVKIVNKGKGTTAHGIYAGLATAVFFLSVTFFCIWSATNAAYILYKVSLIFTAILLLLFMLIMIEQLYLKKESAIWNWAVTVWSVIYVGLPFSLMSVMAFIPLEGYSPIYPLALFIFIWCNDVGAYLIGCSFGRHRLFERVSPKKSWEGFFGGIAFAVVAALVMSRLNILEGAGLVTWKWIGLALVVSIFGTWGDLVESLLKRELGLKDSGHILPGHGGLLDRFDSTLMVLPATAIYLFLVM